MSVRVRVLQSLAVALMLTVALLGSPMPASAASTYYVSPSGDNGNAGTEGSPWRTIAYAISQASSGDTIKVMDDNTDATDDYTENITVNKGLIIERYDSDGTPPWVKASSTASPVFNITTNNVTIKGLYIYGATDALQAGVYIASSISGCTIQDNHCGWDSTHKNRRGIHLYSSSSNNTISGNTASSNTSYGVFLETSDGNTVSGNTVSSNSSPGIYLSSSSSNTISGNTASSNNTYGIHLSSSSSNTVSGNTASSNTSSGIYLSSSSNNTVSGNTYNSHSNYGIYLNTSSSNNTISGNTCSSNTYGIYMMNNSSNNTIYLNSFSNSTNVYSSASTNTWKAPTTLCYFYASSHKNYLGNYYGDHTLTDSNGDGITDAEYDLPGTEPNDAYPLAATSGNYTVQAWYLHSNNTMYEANTGKAPGSVTISASGSQIWISDYPANATATFSTDTWTGQVVFTAAPTDGHTFRVDIGYSTNGSDFTAGADATLTGNGSATTFTYTTDAVSVSVPSGKYLALKITNNSVSAYNVTTGGAWSYTSNPDTGAPDYPVPELSTIILLGIGLAAIAGYLVLRRHQNTGKVNNMLP